MQTLTCRKLLPLTLMAAMAGLTQPAIHAQEQGMDMMQLMQQMMGGSTNATVNFRDLKGLLPETAGGLERTAIEGEKSSAMGVTVTFAEADYEGDDRTRVTVRLNDLSAMGQMMMMAQMAWTQAELDRETEHEYERTTTINGHKAMERYNHRNRDGELQLLIDNRFSVEVTGRNIEETVLREVLGDIDLDALAALEPEAP